VSHQSRYTPELAAEICRRLAAGETLRGICRDPHMPAESSVREWVLDNRDGFATPYRRARDLQLEHWADAIIDIADDGSNDWMERHEKNNVGWQVNGEHVQRSRLRSDNRKWLLSKLRPDKYGERMTNVQSGDPDNPVVTQINYVIVDPKARDVSSE
jgi:hypothetical protein